MRTTDRRARAGVAAAVALVAALVVLVARGAPGEPAARGPAPRLATASVTTRSDARGTALSCPAPDACIAVGSVQVGPTAEAASWREGPAGWSSPGVLPGIASLSSGYPSHVNAVACTSVGDCAAGGQVDEGGPVAFLAVETAGVWGRATTVPGLDQLSPMGVDAVNAVACGAPGSCSAGGFYEAADGTTEAFVADESAGTWSRAIELPGFGTLDVGGIGSLEALSCTGAGTCMAGGNVEAALGVGEAFVDAEQGGVWARAEVLPGMAAVNTIGSASVQSLSCWAPGACVAGGYADSNGRGVQSAFLDSELFGTWSAAIPLPGLGTAMLQGENLFSVSCDTAARCAAGGFVRAGNGLIEPYVALLDDGRWSASPLPAGGLLDAGGGYVGQASCAAGDCTVAGVARVPNRGWQAFALDERGGAWGRVMLLGATATVNVIDQPAVGGLVCAAGARCALVGAVLLAGHADRLFEATVAPARRAP